MSAPTLTTESIAFTEKKVDMSLDDIIKMSKDKPIKSKKQRVVQNKSRKHVDGAQNKSQKVRQYMDSRSSLRQGVLAQRRTTFQGNRFPMASEAAKNAAVAPMRNKAFNKNWTGKCNRPRASAHVNCQVNAPARGFVVKPRFQQQQRQQQQRQQQQQQQSLSQQQTMPKTLDSLFASMKEQRKQTFGHQNKVVNQRTGPIQQRQAWGRGQRFRY